MRTNNIEIEKLPSTKLEASKNGSRHYFTGTPCIRNHSAPRYTSTGQCVTCQKENYRKHTGHNPRPSKQEYLQRAQQLAIERGGKCLSTEYLSAKSKMTFVCANPDHPPFPVSSDNLKRGRWCKNCRSDGLRGNLSIP